MTQNEKNSMQRLVDELNDYAYRYYVLDDPAVTDDVYDKLYDELLALERDVGERLPDSPTTRVGGEPISLSCRIRTSRGCTRWINAVLSTSCANGRQKP